MFGKFQDDFRPNEIKPTDIEGPNLQHRMELPSVGDLKSKLEDIFTFKPQDGPELPSEIPSYTPLERQDSGRVTLEDGTVIEIPSSIPEPTKIESASETETNPDTKSNAVDDAEDTKPTRELTEDEKSNLKETLGWSDKQIAKCTIDEDGGIHYKTDRSDLEGKTSKNGVTYERRRIEINGVVIEGVFPKFESVFDTELAPENLKTKSYAEKCNEALKEAIENDPELRCEFTDEQIQDIEKSRTPRGYVWHHNEEPGKMQLVKREDHDRVIGGAAHTGGNSLWGADSVDSFKKGEDF